MNRLALTNLVGVCFLAGVCVLQWTAQRRLNLERIELQKARIDLEQRLADQDRELRGARADLENFRGDLTRTAGLLRETETRARVAEELGAALSRERDELRHSNSNWIRAVELRDARLGELETQLQGLAGERNDAVTRFNELAGKYNALVEEVNAAREQLNSAVTNSSVAR